MHIDSALTALREGDEAATRAFVQQPAALSRIFPTEVCPDALGRGRGGNRALAVATYFGHTPILDLLLEAGAETEHRNEEGRTALHIGLEHNYRAAQHLVSRDVPKDVVACACLHEHEALRDLLSQDPNLANDFSTGLSVLGWATYYGAKRSAEILKEFGARGDDCELLCAAGTANVEMAEFLLELGLDVNQRRKEAGATPLHVAAAHEFSCDAAEFVRFLLERGADPGLTAGPNAVTALELARDCLREQQRREIPREDDGWRNFDGVIAILEAAKHSS